VTLSNLVDALAADGVHIPCPTIRIPPRVFGVALAARAFPSKPTLKLHSHFRAMRVLAEPVA
jgi:hypothetical protein